MFLDLLLKEHVITKVRITEKTLRVMPKLRDDANSESDATLRVMPRLRVMPILRVIQATKDDEAYGL